MFGGGPRNLSSIFRLMGIGVMLPSPVCGYRPPGRVRSRHPLGWWLPDTGPQPEAHGEGRHSGASWWTRPAPGLETLLVPKAELGCPWPVALFSQLGGGRG